MNRVQEVIAQVTGLDGIVDSQEAQLNEIADVMEHLVSDNQMLQRQIEDLDYLNLYEMNQIEEILPIRDRRKSIARLRRLRHDNPLAKQAVKLVIRFTLGQGVQWVLAKESDVNEAPPTAADPQNGPLPPPTPISGGPTPPVQIPRSRGAKEAIVDTGDQTRDILSSFWSDQDNQLAFTTRKSMQQFLDDIVTDGEKFHACFEDPAAPYVKVSEIPIEEIDKIVYHPENRLKPVFYRRQFQPTKYDAQNDQIMPVGNPKVLYYWDYRIKEEDQAEILKIVKVPKSKIGDGRIKHTMINEIWTKSGKRGLSELYASREWFRVFREFMEGRAAINSAAQAISFLRKIKGSPATVARFSGKLGGLPVGENADPSGEIRKLTRPVQGAIYDSNEAVDLEWMKTDTGAVNAKEDARLLLMSAGAGVGTMAHYFGEGGDANLATAQSMELPMVKSYEDWQQFIEDFFKEWFEYVLIVATGGTEEDVKDDLNRIGFTFPPIISQDVVKYTTSWAQIVRDIAPNNMAVKRQAMRAVLSVMKVPNIDGLMPEIEAEMAQAEAMRIQQQKEMAAAQLAAGNAAAGGPGDNRPPVAGKIPNQGLGPNLKRVASGKPEKVSNGPKSA